MEKPNHSKFWIRLKRGQNITSRFVAKPSFWTETFLSTTSNAVPIFLRPWRSDPSLDPICHFEPILDFSGGGCCRRWAAFSPLIFWHFLQHSFYRLGQYSALLPCLWRDIWLWSILLLNTGETSTNIHKRHEHQGCIKSPRQVSHYFRQNFIFVKTQQSYN